MRNITTFKALVVCIGLTLSVIYVFFSYIQTSKHLQNEDKILFLKAKEEITEAVEKFQQYLNLTESRLINPLHTADAIPQILSLRAEYLIKGGRFPEIISMAFISVTDPTTSYSKYGKMVLNSNAQSGEKEDGITHLGKGKFRANRVLYDKNKKPFGRLQSTFSIEHFLHKHFSENEVSILPKQQVNLSREPFTFKVLNFPYIFVLNSSPLSFKAFLLGFKWEILSALAFGIALLLIGVAGGTFFKHKIIMKYRALNQQLRETLRAFEKENADLSTQLVISRNLLKLKDQAKKGTALLLNTIQDRYRQMAAQAQSIHILTSKLIAEEAGNDKLLNEIHSVSKDSTTVLARLIDGYPAKEIEEEIDVLHSIEVIKMIFLPELIERNITFEIKGKIKTLPSIDKLTFEIILHNIFHIVMGRLNKNNLLKIELKEKNSLQIIFYDNGYNIEEKLHIVKNSRDLEDILRLGRNRLREFTNYLGWELLFQSGKGSLNSIKLSIPQAFQKKSFPSNVVSLFDFRSSGV